MNTHPSIKITKLRAKCRIASATAIAILLTSAFLPFVGSLFAATNWPAERKSLYVNNCTQDIVAKGMMEYWSRKYCSCLADGMEKEFGTEEYEQMRLSKPNAAGSAYDKRLYIVFDACKDYFPKKKHRPGSPLQ